MSWILFLAGFLPADWDGYKEHHVHVIEFNTDWGELGFNQSRKILFWNYVVVRREKDNAVQFSKELHIVDAYWTDEFPRMRTYDGEQFLELNMGGVHRRIRFDHFIKTDVWGNCPEKRDNEVYPRHERVGLR